LNFFSGQSVHIGGARNTGDELEDALKTGGVADAGRIEMPGSDLHQFGLNGALLDLDEARAAIAAELSA
jgi:hypothetical protein